MTNMEFHKSQISFVLPIAKGSSVQRNPDSIFSLKNISRRSRLTEKYDIAGPIASQFPDMNRRHSMDRAFVQKDFIPSVTHHFIANRHICNDSTVSLSRTVSYSNFHIPLRIRCLANYKRAKRKYEEQFQKEITNLVDYQTSALEACQFVRMMSYLTLWPPLHTSKELHLTTKNFFKLDKEEESRFKKIMSTDLI